MSLRLFVALPVAPEVAARLDTALDGRRAATDWAWTRPEGWHVTLAFLGDVYDDVEPGVARYESVRHITL